MKKPQNIIIGLTVLLSLIILQVSAQTVSDTASVITGTEMHGLLNTEHVEPEKPEQYDQNIEVTNDPDTIIKNAYRNSLLAYYHSIERRNKANAITFDSVSTYYSWALKNRQNIITRQQTTGSIIFILVIVLVLSGLTFSAIQFYIALKSAKRKVSLPDTSLKASLSGVEVSSSVLGVIILTISIVFFYLYLNKVYPLVSLDQVTIQSPK